MDITNASMTSLLKEALTPQPVPSAKADPATAALVKALVQPPAPSFVPSAQVGAQALNGSLPRPAAEPSSACPPPRSRTPIGRHGAGSRRRWRLDKVSGRQAGG
ncbi:hypothetical protein [Mesorhizobium sp.]|uniref:hypothetical protein n=1 Tax=Mesorhizobium sp. TaxID=1871066 RepID=UPI000FE66FF3|nr:hypothetical protein [Mesorhizobium sp.]RWK07934.1 MAG: hypothetical protein EOR39_21140 [Mesorhizobium sp.]